MWFLNCLCLVLKKTIGKELKSGSVCADDLDKGNIILSYMPNTLKVYTLKLDVQYISYVHEHGCAHI
jgi:hypothetical protein